MSAPSVPVSPDRRTAQSPAVTASTGSTLPVYTAYLLRRSRTSTLVWTISLALYAALIVFIYPSSKGTDVSNYSTGLKEAFNVTNFDVLPAYLATELFSYLPIVLAFVPILAATGAIAGAEENGSLDILLGTPLPRRFLVIAVAVTAIVNVTVMMVVMALTLWLSSLTLDSHLALSRALAGSLTVVPIALAHGGFALACSAVMRQRSRALGVSVGAILVMYAVNVVARIVDSLDWLRYFSTFYWSGNAIVERVFWSGVGVLLVAAAVCTLVAMQRFERRDIYV